MQCQLFTPLYKLEFGLSLSLQLLLSTTLAETLEGGNRRSGVGVGVVLLQSHGDGVVHVQSGLGVISLGLEVDNQVILDSEDGVDIEVRVIAGVDLVDDSGVVGVGDHQVNVSRTHGRAVHEAQQNTGGTIGRQRVRGRVVAVPVELALLVGAELAAKVVLRLVGVLEIVLAVGGSLPDIKNGTDDGSTGLHISQNTVHVGDLTVGVGVLNDRVAKSAEGSIGRPEGAQNDVGSGGLALLGDDLVGDLIDEGLETNDIANTVALVANGGADLSDGVDELNTHHPFSGGEFDLTGEVVNVGDEGAQDDTSTLGGVGSHGVHHVGGEVRVEAGVGRHIEGIL